MDDTRWLITREIPHLRRYALALVRDAEEADDLVQDCLERALRKRHLWKATGSLRSWLFRMLYNQFINGRTRQSRWRSLLPLDELATPPVEMPRQEVHADCRHIGEELDRLPEQQRAAILLVALEDVSYDEAAGILGIPIGTLRSRLSRGREALRAIRPQRTTEPQLRRVK